jgi:hypothetical protein
MPPIATSAIDICNLMLDKIGVKTISSLSEESAQARQCNRLYETTRAGLLEEYTWFFAKKRAALSQLATTPAWGFDYEYQLPNDMRRLLSVENDITFEKEGDKLLTNETSVNILYIQNIDDPVQMPALFIRAFYLKMAVDAAPKLATSTKVAELQAEYKSAIRDAIQKGAAQRNLGVDEFPTPDWVSR